MKKSLITLLAAVLVASIIGVSAPAISANDDRGTVSVSATANTEISPDVAEISFAVQTSDPKSMQKATLSNKEISDKVLNELKSLINTDNGDFIKTSDFNASPVYSYINNKRTLDKYEVSNRIIVHTKSIDKLGKMIDSAIAAGATNVQNLTFSASNYEAQCNDLISIAAKKARKSADTIAKAMNTSILGINNITTSCSTNNFNQPRFYMAKNMAGGLVEGAADTAELSTTISNGVVKINANLNASFFIK